jgi:excinuclease UvrABC nuclease subunit
MSRWVYLHKDADGGVLYVGCTNDLRRRTRDHRRISPWRGQIAAVEVDSHREDGDALRREMELIRLHEPPHNVRSNPATERAYRTVKDAEAREFYADFHRARAS